MADITIKCGKCGRDNTVSEYASVGAVSCASCGQTLELPSGKKAQNRLQMRKLERDDGGVLGAGDPKNTQSKVAKGTVPVSGVLDDVHKTRQKTKTPLAVWGWLLFLAFSGLLVGIEYFVTQVDQSFMQWYLMGRLGVWGFITLLVVIVAWEDSSGQGLMCIFVPFYIIYYAFIRVEYYWLRGLFLAVVVGMCAELYYLPKDAAFTRAQLSFNKFIVAVETQMDRASDSPDMPERIQYRRGNKRVVIPKTPKRPRR